MQGSDGRRKRRVGEVGRRGGGFRTEGNGEGGGRVLFEQKETKGTKEGVRLGGAADEDLPGSHRRKTVEDGLGHGLATVATEHSHLPVALAGAWQDYLVLSVRFGKNGVTNRAMLRACPMPMKIESADDAMRRVEAALRRHASGFRRRCWRFKPEMQYHLFADAVFWVDEYPIAHDPDLEDAFRLVLNHRTSLLTGSEGKVPQVWQLARQCFPKWIGFRRSRCTFNPKTAERIARIRRVAAWRIKRCFAEFDEGEIL